MKYFAILFLTLSFFSACQKKEQNVLFKEVSNINRCEDTIDLSRLITDSVRIIPLETNNESILGRINKIKKVNGQIYVLSNDQWIFHFNEKGNYISTLKKQGNGPDEYVYINDFDIYSESGHSEIWIADNQKIKIYDADSLNLLKEIHFPFFIHKFKRIQANKILCMSGQSEHSLLITDENGRILQEYLDKEIPYLLFRAIQFKPYLSDIFLFQLGISNNYVAYHIDGGTFTEGKFFTSSNGLLSQKALIDLFEDKGQDFIRYFNKYSYIQSFFARKDKIWFYIQNFDQKLFVKIENEQNVSGKIDPECNIHNDLFSIQNLSFLTTLGFGESDSGLLFYLDPSDLSESDNYIYLKNGNKIHFTEDDNPIILEFSDMDKQ